MFEPYQPGDFSRMRFRLFCVRHDGSSASPMGYMSWDEAVEARDVIREADIFATVEILSDDPSGGESSAASGSTR
jgi:hypothetical protein